MTRQEAEALLKKYLEGKCTDEEKSIIREAYLRIADMQTSDISSAKVAGVQASAWKTVKHKAWHKSGGTLRRLSATHILTAAAILIVALATALYFYPGLIVNHKSGIINQDILPGYNQATLTLADGQTIRLDSAQSGIVIGAEDIKYTNGNSLTGVMLSEAEASHKKEGQTGETLSTSLHSASRQAGTGKGDVLWVLSTPKGGQYQIILSDGTKVWLNAASKMKYPSRFSGKERIVEIEGEAFFDIKEDKTKPFKVKSQNQEISVLGTSFNVSAYADESSVRTTLVSGAVQVSMINQSTNQSMVNQRLLSGQQSIVSKVGIHVKTVDVNSALAWRNGYFMFDHDALERVLGQVSRWYNVEVRYENEGLKKQVFSGSISRYTQVSQVLKTIELTGAASFEISGRTIIVKPFQ